MAPKQTQSESNSYDIVLVGGGSAGITTAAHLVKQLRKEKLNARILIIDPAENHYYQRKHVGSESNGRGDNSTGAFFL